jgi:hypothetical protein
MFAARFFRRSQIHVAARIPSSLSRFLHSSHILRTAADMVEKVHTTERLVGLRKLMKELNIDVYSTGCPSHLGTESC